MSWAYCAPKSTTRTVSGAAAAEVADDTGCLPAVGAGVSVPILPGCLRATFRLTIRPRLDTVRARGILGSCSLSTPSSLPMATGPPAAMVVLLELLTSDFPGAPGRYGPGRLTFADRADPGLLIPTPRRSK